MTTKMATMKQRVERLEGEAEALRVALTDDAPQVKCALRADGLLYRWMAYRLLSAHGGYVVCIASETGRHQSRYPKSVRWAGLLDELVRQSADRPRWNDDDGAKHAVQLFTARRRNMVDDEVRRRESAGPR